MGASDESEPGTLPKVTVELPLGNVVLDPIEFTHTSTGSSVVVVVVVVVVMVEVVVGTVVVVEGTVVVVGGTVVVIGTVDVVGTVVGVEAVVEIITILVVVTGSAGKHTARARRGRVIRSTPYSKNRGSNVS